MNGSLKVVSPEVSYSTCEICGRQLYLFRHHQLMTCTQWIFCLMDDCGDQLPGYLVHELVRVQVDCYRTIRNGGCGYVPVPPPGFLRLEGE
jgi:hypothetical protein